LENLLAFILLIGPLIFFHELGHLVAAKLVDIKVVRFSIGFGPALLKVRLGETEYCLAPIPLGGYVQVLGHRPGEDVGVGEADRALTAKPLWAKYLFYLAGPLANLALPVVVYFFWFVINHTMVTAPVIGTVLPGSAADEAGLQQGDRIVAIDDRDVRSWTEMASRVADNPEQDLEVQIERDGKRLDRVITPKKIVRRNELGVAEERGQLGVINVFYAPEIGIIDPESPASVEGLRTGDVVTSINGEPVRTIEELDRMLELTSDALVRLTYLRPTQREGPGGTYLWYESHHAQLLPRKGGDNPTGIVTARTFIRTVDPDSPAAEAGLEPGDRILAVDDEEFHQWVQLDDVFSRKREESIKYKVQSPGQPPRDVEITLGKRVWKDIYDYEHDDLWFGAYPYDKSSRGPPEPLRGRVTYAMRAAVDKTAEVTYGIWTGLVQMLSGRMGVDKLSSVVGMFAVAGAAYEQGPGQFMWLLALVSINLFIINLLPIPVLDGGHLLFFTIEAVRRKPLSQRAREISAAVGLVIVLLLLLIATRNDIVRHFL
jgi:regulator of sigma E protease